MMNKKLMWGIISALCIFGGWITKDVPHSKAIGQFIMGLGFFIGGVVLFAMIWPDVKQK